MDGRLYRSPDDRVLAGVAGGMAETYDLDPALVRVGWALLILLTGGVFLILYIVMALVVPLRPEGMMLWPARDTEGNPMAQQDEDTTTTPGAPTGPQPAGQYAPWAYRRRPRDRSEATGPIVIGLILIVAGAFFLVRQFIPALNVSLLWPLVVIAGGVLLIVAAFTRRGSGQ